MIKLKTKNNRLLILLFTIIVCLALAFYIGFIMAKEEVYTQFFYIPVILAGMWYYRKAVYIAIFLGMVHIFVTYISVHDVSIDSFGRFAILLVVAYVIGLISQKRAEGENKLRETHDYLENLINYANAPIIVWDPEFRITRFNRAFEHLTAYTAGEVVGHELNMLFPEASRDDSLTKIKRTSRGEFWESVEIPILRKDGEVRIALWNSAAIYTKDGKTIIAIIAQGQDITDFMDADAKLRKEKKFSENIVATITDSLLVIDNNLKIKSANLTFYKTFKIDSEKIIGTCITGFLGDEDGRLGTELTALFETGGILENFELNYQSEKTGERVFNIIARGIIIAEEEEEEEEELIVLQDITERKQAEKKISDTLSEKEKLLKEIHHRVKNNLQALLYLSEMQSEKVTNQLCKEVFYSLNRQIFAMSMVHEKLYRSENLAKINFKEYIEDLTDNLLDTSEAFKNIQMRVKADDCLVDINFAIPCALIINELVTNSLKYAFPNDMGKENEIQVEFKNQENQWILIDSDNGIGIPDNIDYHNVTTLGLTLVKAWAIHQLGGTLDLDTRNGTKFTMKIPKRKIE